MNESKETTIDNSNEKTNNQAEIMNKSVNPDIVYPDREAIADTINDYYTKFRIDEIKRDPRKIDNMDNPAEEFQLAAVEQNFKVIKCIDNPCKKARLFAAKQI
jgi:hypothetical protein